MEIERELNTKSRIPGPADYNTKRYKQKWYRSYGATVFGRDKRGFIQFNKEAAQVPGPGNYRIQSDFGVYNPSDT